MSKKIIALVSSGVLLALPLASVLAIRIGDPPPGAFAGSIVALVNIILNFIWPLFVGFAVIMFIVAGFMFLTARGDPEKTDTARQAILWGVVGIVVGILAFSIPFIIQRTICNVPGGC